MGSFSVSALRLGHTRLHIPVSEELKVERVQEGRLFCKTSTAC